MIILWVSELQNLYLMCQILTMNIFFFCCKPHYNGWYSFEVCIHWESDICWQVDILLANKESFLLHAKSRCSFKNLKGWLQAVFLTAFTPHPIPHHFLFGPWISCCEAESLTPRPRKWKTHPKKWTAMQAKQSQSLFKFFIRNCQAQLFKRWIVPPTEQITIHWITHTNIIIIICFPILIHWILISLADSAIHLLNNKALGLYLWDLKRKHQSESLLHLV